MPHSPADQDDADSFGIDRRLIDALTEHGVLPWELIQDSSPIRPTERHG